jgi:hypothetical protein
MPEFWFHHAGIDGFHFESCGKYVDQQGLMGIPWWPPGLVDSVFTGVQ